MTFLDRLLLGKNIPAYTDTSHFPSSTYKARRCLKKHCTDACFVKKDFEWEFWAFFLSEKEVQRTQLMKKMNTLTKDLRFSVWYKLSGARNIFVKINIQFEIHKSDRKLVDFILETCRIRSVSDIISKNDIEKCIFLVYRNIYDIFYEKNENNAENVEKDNIDSKIELDVEKKVEKDTEMKIKNLEDSKKIRADNESIDLYSVKTKKNEYENMINEINNNIFTDNCVDEELVMLIDYMFKKNHSSLTNVFKLLYVFFIRLGFDKIFLCDITNKSDVAKSLNTDYFTKLQRSTRFGFIKVFIRYMIENDPEVLDQVLDLSLCFSASSFCEIVGFLIKHTEPEISEIINNEEKSYEKNIGQTKHHNAKQHNAKQHNVKQHNTKHEDKDNKEHIEKIDNNNVNNIVNHNTKKHNNFKNELLEAHEKITNKSKSSLISDIKRSENIAKQSDNVDDQMQQNDIAIKYFFTKEEIEEKQNNMNLAIAKVLYKYLRENTNDKLEQIRKSLKPQKIDALEIEEFETCKNEEYFDFLVVQNESVKAQVGLKSDLFSKLETMNHENEKLILQNTNLKESIETLESELKEFEQKYLNELKSMLVEASNKNAVLEKENEKLKKKLSN
ncbi:hypothetical protein BDAP_002125 [Binucleata daphniae]